MLIDDINHEILFKLIKGATSEAIGEYDERLTEKLDKMCIKNIDLKLSEQNRLCPAIAYVTYQKENNKESDRKVGNISKVVVILVAVQSIWLFIKDKFHF